MQSLEASLSPAGLPVRARLPQPARARRNGRGRARLDAGGGLDGGSAGEERAPAKKKVQ